MKLDLRVIEAVEAAKVQLTSCWAVEEIETVSTNQWEVSFWHALSGVFITCVVSVDDGIAHIDWAKKEYPAVRPSANEQRTNNLISMSHERMSKHFEQLAGTGRSGMFDLILQAVAREIVIWKPYAEDTNAESNQECVWTSDDNGVWRTDCGNAFQFTDDGPTENGIKFCPYCGRACKPIVTRFD